MEHEELLSVIEAILFAAGDPVPASRIALVTGEETQTIVSAARELAAAYEENRCGMRLVQMNDLLQLCSAPEYADYIRRALEHAAHREREDSRDDADEREHENRQIVEPHELIYAEHRAEHSLVDGEHEQFSKGADADIAKLLRRAE